MKIWTLVISVTGTFVILNLTGLGNITWPVMLMPFFVGLSIEGSYLLADMIIGIMETNKGEHKKNNE